MQRLYTFFRHFVCVSKKCFVSAHPALSLPLTNPVRLSAASKSLV